jgi:hypothetical protein
MTGQIEREVTKMPVVEVEVDFSKSKREKAEKAVREK